MTDIWCITTSCVTVLIIIMVLIIIEIIIVIGLSTRGKFRTTRK